MLKEVVFLKVLDSKKQRWGTFKNLDMINIYNKKSRKMKNVVRLR